MEARDFIESGILELYVYGQLNDEDVAEVRRMASEYPEVGDEIRSIEKSIIGLTAGFAPHLPCDTYNKLRERLRIKTRKRSAGIGTYLGWFFALIILSGAAYLFYELNESNSELVNLENDRQMLKDSIIALETRGKLADLSMSVVRDNNNTMVLLGGQPVSPEATARVYWNRQTHAVYVDASGLPSPPDGYVYQVWAMTYRPFVPTTIGLLENFAANDAKFFSISNADAANAFGITLEPAGGSESPTLEQLHVIGRVQ